MLIAAAIVAMTTLYEFISVISDLHVALTINKDTIYIISEYQNT